MSDNLPLQELINKTVTLEGRTAMVKSRAVLLVNDNPVYIEGLDYWPPDFSDKQAILSGKLVFKSYVSKAETNENELMGRGDNDYVLEQAVIEIGKGDFGYEQLTDTRSFLQGQQEAIKAIITELENEKENPKEFFAKFEADATASKLSFVLMHQDSFKIENLNAIGNPSGKDRKAIYDLIQKKVNFLFYQ